MKYGKRLLKFEGEDRLDLNIIIHAVGSITGEKSMKEAKKRFMQALRTNGVICCVADMVQEQKSEERIKESCLARSVSK